MKRLFFMLTVCLLAVCLAVPVLAADKDSRTIDVRAKYVSELPWDTAASDEGGHAKIILPDGTEVSVDGIPDGRWTLVVDVITEEAVLEYIDSVAEKELADRLQLHIFFLDENDTVRSPEGVTITVHPAKKPKNPAVYTLTCGALERLPATADGFGVRFAATADTVYVLGDLPEKIPETPKTGDDSRLILWITMAALSGGILAGAAAAGKRRNFELAQ